MGNQRRKKSPHAEESQLQRHHHRVLELLRRDLQARSLDAVGHAQLRKGSAYANHGHGPRGFAGAFSQCAHWNGLFKPMKSATKSKKVSALASELLPERELRRIADTVLRLAKSTSAEETEVHVDEVANALTRFANNAIHQNVAEHGLTVSIRTVTDRRTAPATTNRFDEHSPRSTIEASLSLAHSQPKVPNLLPMPGKQRYRTVNRFVKQTAALSAEDRARAVRRGCGLAVKKGQVAAGIFSNGKSQSALATSRGLFAAYRETHSGFSITMQEGSAASWAKANSADVRTFDPLKLAARVGEKAQLALNAHAPAPGHYPVLL